MSRFLVFFLFLNLHLSGQTCDSIIVVYQTNHNQFDPVMFVGLQIDSLKNGLIDTRYFSDGRPSIKYKHDSLGRLTSITSNDSTVFIYDTLNRIVSVEYFQWNGTSWNYKQDTSQVNYFYSTNRLDSIVKSNWNGSIMKPFYRSVRFYNAVDKLFRINVELFDSVNLWFIDTLVTVSYTPLRTDSLYANGVITTYPDERRSYDSSERILNITEIIGWSSNMVQYFSYQCNQLSSYVRTHIGSHSSFNTIITFDSLCRIKKIVSGNYYLSGGYTENVYEYYYTSCNTMVVRADEDRRVCQGDTTELSLMHFGGTPPYTINWSPNSVFPDDSSLMVYAAPDSSINYLVTVTDSNGLIVTDTLAVHVATRPLADIYISAIDTNSTCQSATLKTDSLLGIYYSWNETSSIVTLSYYSELNIIYNGTYRLVAQEDVPGYLITCPVAVDSIIFNYFSNPAPVVDVSLKCDYFVAHSTEPLQFQWYKNNLLIVDSIRDTLSVNQSGVYNVIGVDSAGCLSAPANSSYQAVNNPLSLNINIGHPSCSTCSDGFVNLQGIGGASNYRYSINGILIYSTFQDSLPAGLYQFCVMDNNNCMYCDSVVYIRIDEIADKDVSFYPNPFIDIMYFNYPGYRSTNEAVLMMYDVSGRRVKEQKITSSEFTITRSDFSRGIYFVSLVENKKMIWRGKIIIN